MRKTRLHKLFTAIAVALSLVVAFTTLVGATNSAAPVSQTTRAKEVRGTLPGGKFAQIWLGLEPETSGAQVTVIAEWDRNNPAASGINFFILDDQGVRRVGEDPLSAIALGAGNPNFDVNAPDNQVGASFNAIGLAKYTIVVSNESSQDASFTLRVTNGFILDDSNQVVNPNAPITTTTTTTTTPQPLPRLHQPQPLQRRPRQQPQRRQRQQPQPRRQPLPQRLQRRLQPQAPQPLPPPVWYVPLPSVASCPIKMTSTSWVFNQRAMMYR